MRLDLTVIDEQEWLYLDLLQFPIQEGEIPLTIKMADETFYETGCVLRGGQRIALHNPNLLLPVLLEKAQAEVILPHYRDTF